MCKPEVVECEFSSQYRQFKSNYVWSAPKQYVEGINNYLKYLRTDRDNAIIESGGFKIAEKFGYSRQDFSLEDVRSFYSYKKLWEQFGNFQTDIKTNYDPKLLHAAAQIAVNELGIQDGSLELDALDVSLYTKIDPGKNAGLPSLENKGDQFGYALSRAISIIYHGKHFTPAVATVRTQRKHKTRLAWAMPLDQVLIEHTIYGPIMENLSFNHPLLSRNSSSIIAQKIYSSEIRYKYNVGIDYSQFDARVPSGVIRVIFNKLKQLFNTNNKTDDYLFRFEKTFEKVIQGFIDTIILMPDGHLYQKHRGIPSGSQLTSLIGSLCNLTMLKYYFMSSKIHGRSLALGDDSASFINNKISLNHLSAFMSRVFGMIVNPSKCSFRNSGDGVEVLGYLYKRGFRQEDPRKTLAKLIFPETNRKTVHNYSYFLSNLVLEYSLTNVNLYENLHKAIRRPSTSPRNLRPYGSPKDYVTYAKSNRNLSKITKGSRSGYLKEIGESVVAHAFS